MSRFGFETALFCANFLVKEVMAWSSSSPKAGSGHAYWSAVGMATATMLTMQPVLATATGTGIRKKQSAYIKELLIELVTNEITEISTREVVNVLGEPV